MVRVKRDPNNPLVLKNFMAPAKLLLELQVRSAKEGISESEIIRKALELYMEGSQGKAPSPRAE